MRVTYHYQAILISVIIISFSVFGVFLLRELSPELYNQITGEITATTLNITPADPVPCNFTIESGMNLVTFFCVGDFIGIANATVNLTQMEGIFSYEIGASDPWRAYNPNLPSWVVSDLTYLSKKKGYWVRMFAQQQYFYNGFLPSTANIPIVAGYQLLGYPQNYTQAIAAGLQTINGSYSKVVSYDPITDVFEIFTVPGGGSLTTLDANRGYWINGTASDIWVVS